MGLKAWANTNGTVWATSNGTIVTSLVDADNPEGIRPYTVRFKFDDTSYNPTNESWASGSFWVQVTSEPNVWDFTYVNSSWIRIFDGRFQNRQNLVHILGANLLGVNAVGIAFRDCTALRSVSTMDLSTATSMDSLFSGCTAVTSITGLNTASTTDTTYMFRGCTSLTTVPLFDTSNVTRMLGMFDGCTSLTTVPLFNTANTTDMTSMLYGCTSLTTVPLFNTAKAISMTDMFRDCTSLTTAPLFNTATVTDMKNMFSNCSSLTAVPLYNTINATNVEHMFFYCRSVESGALSLYQQMASQVIVPETHSGCFTNCGIETVTGLADLEQIPTSWGGRMA